MAIQGIMLRACSVVGPGYKSLLSTRFFAPLYQQTSNVSVESKLGLPEKPKRPHSAFLLFANARRPELKAQHPDLPMKELAKKIGQEWHACAPDLKKKFCDEAAVIAKKYGEALQKYHLSLSEEQMDAIRDAKAKVRDVKHAKSLKKKMKLLEKPKLPKNAYTLFVQEKMNGPLKESDGSIQEKIKKVAEMWKAAPKEVVDSYREKAEALRRQYRADIEAWEEKMVSSGHMDIFGDQNKRKPKKNA